MIITIMTIMIIMKIMMIIISPNNPLIAPQQPLKAVKVAKKDDSVDGKARREARRAVLSTYLPAWSYSA